MALMTIQLKFYNHLQAIDKKAAVAKESSCRFHESYVQLAPKMFHSRRNTFKGSFKAARNLSPKGLLSYTAALLTRNNPTLQ